jgi:WD40 repeat protein
VTIRSNIRTDITFAVPAPNGRELVAIGAGGSVELWDLTTRRPIRTLFPLGKTYITAAAYSADSRTLAVGVINAKKQGELWLLDMPNGTLRDRWGPFNENQVSGPCLRPQREFVGESLTSREFGVQPRREACGLSRRPRSRYVHLSRSRCPEIQPFIASGWRA